MVESSLIAKWCNVGALPDDIEFYKVLLDQPDRFTEREGETWDFKREWPFSLSDKYFGGICRLACAFANTNGGLIIFGVHDEFRTGGKNKVTPNIDKFLTAFTDLTGEVLEYDFRSYENAKIGDVQVLLIKPRSLGSRPFRFRKSVHKYKAGIYWIRRQQDVLQASAVNYPSLFCGTGISEKAKELDGSIPPSPSQIKTFVGRTEVLDQLFYWLSSSDEPRNYLHGKGGSGKTTIAHEFTRLLKSFGADVRLSGEDKIDFVIFLSAKERELITSTSTVEKISNPDFFDAQSLLVQILSHTGWIAQLEEIEKLNLEALQSEVKQFFDDYSCVIVLDDIDTLTTKGVDPGSDFLYFALARSKKRSKILYTIRNAPTQSIHNSIEVPGLTGTDYLTFVDRCVHRFKVAAPSPDFRDNRLPSLSEGRPLIIESIIALVRTAGSYDRAEQLFGQNIGDNVRDYVFRREWDALSGDYLARLLLAALSDFKKPVTFADIQVVLGAGKSTIQDAIGKTREMFLEINDAGADALYSLTPLTKSFINQRKEQLKYYAKVREKVRNYKKNIRFSSPQVIRIVNQVQRYLPLRKHEHTEINLREALRLVTDISLDAKITEDPVFKCIFGYVHASQTRPNFSEVRDAFEYSCNVGSEPEFSQIRTWYEIERTSGDLNSKCDQIADFVVEGRTYTEFQKINMISLKASNKFNLARAKLYTNIEDSETLFTKSLQLHLKAFKLYADSGSHQIDQSERFARNTATELFNMLSQSETPWVLFKKIQFLLKNMEGYIDPIEQPLIDAIQKLRKRNLILATSSRLGNELKVLSKTLTKRNIWLDYSRADFVDSILDDYYKFLKSNQKK